MNTISKLTMVLGTTSLLVACSPRDEVSPPTQKLGQGGARFEISDFGIPSYTLIRDDLSSAHTVHCNHFNPEKQAQRNEIALYSIQTAKHESAEERPTLVGGLLVPLDEGTTCVDMTTGASPQRIRSQCTFDPPVLTPYVLKPGRSYRCSGRRSFETSFNATLQNIQNNSWRIAIEIKLNP